MQWCWLPVAHRSGSCPQVRIATWEFLKTADAWTQLLLLTNNRPSAFCSKASQDILICIQSWEPQSYRIMDPLLSMVLIGPSNLAPIYFCKLIFYLFSHSYPITCIQNTYFLLFPEPATLFSTPEPLPVLIALPRMPFTVFLLGISIAQSPQAPERIASLTSVTGFTCVIIYVPVFQGTLNSWKIRSYSFLFSSTCHQVGKLPESLMDKWTHENVQPAAYSGESGNLWG